ncbi:MAG: bifunctional phosphoglucose/phosphomannose isomerase [Patescibacteria group bacterium]
MEESIRNFSKQLSYVPVIENASAIKEANSFVLCGMGGSHLSAGLLKLYDARINLSVHYDYGLPESPNLKESLLIASSYSGNTAETIDFAQKAFTEELDLIVITSGGKLLSFAQENAIPYIALPSLNIQPRNAIGYSLLALAKAAGNISLISTLSQLEKVLNPGEFENQGKEIALKLQGKIPIIYSSNINHSLAYNWKIKFNETTKIPAFFNMFPELNHNELSGFDSIESTKNLSRPFHFIFLEDENDYIEVRKRMEITKNLFLEQGFSVESLTLVGENVLERAFNSIFLADWVAFHLAQKYGVDPESVPLIEKFKTLLRP